MANNKLYGYTPKMRKPSSDKGKAYAGLEKGKTYENLGNRLDLSDLSNGLYNLSIIHKDKRYNKQIIKQ